MCSTVYIHSACKISSIGIISDLVFFAILYWYVSEVVWCLNIFKLKTYRVITKLRLRIFTYASLIYQWYVSTLKWQFLQQTINGAEEVMRCSLFENVCPFFVPCHDLYPPPPQFEILTQSLTLCAIPTQLFLNFKKFMSFCCAKT